MATAHGLRIKNQFLFPPIDGNASPDSPSVTRGTVQSLTQAQILQRLRELPVLWAEDIGPLELWAPSIGSLVRGWIKTLNSGNITVRQDGIWDYGPLTGALIRDIGF